MKTVKMPIYTIGKGKYQLKEYKKMKEKETREIALILGIENEETEIKVKISSKSFFSLILIPLGSTPLDADELDFEQSFEIVTDYLAERGRFNANMGEYFVSLLKKKNALLKNGLN
jgi:hypothetical protein